MSEYFIQQKTLNNGTILKLYELCTVYIVYRVLTIYLTSSYGLDVYLHLISYNCVL